MLDWGGTAVAVGVPAPDRDGRTCASRAFTHVERTLTGSRAGSHRPHYDIPLIVDMYQRGLIKLDELVSRDATRSTTGRPASTTCTTASSLGACSRSAAP